MTTKVNLKINQGETYRHTIFWTDADGLPIDLTQYTADMHIRGKISDAIPLLELTTENGRIFFPDALAGEIQIYLTAADTAAINWVSGVYDLEMLKTGGDVTRIIEGTVSITKEVTR